MESIFELKQQMLFLERAHASARMGHFVLDPKRRTIEFSSWVRDNIGLNDMPIPIDRLPEIVPEDERAQLAKTVTNVIKSEEDFGFEINVITAKGAVRTQRVKGIPAFEDQFKKQGLIGYYGILQEITRERQAERDLIEARDKAEAELEARSNILATVSHEIRTPLGGILGIIDQLKRERSATERDRAIGLMEDSCEALLETLDSILQQAKLSKNAAEREFKTLRPNAVAQRVAELFRPVARRKALRIDVSTSSEAQVFGDAGRIQQVLANFVSNAIKFTQSGQVTIYVQEPLQPEDDWVFVVSDTGSGMDQKRMDTIFEAYDTDGQDSLGKSVGLGLGLSITREIVDSMNGRIEVESEIGVGSSFTVFLPLKTVKQELSKADSKVHGTVYLAVQKATEQIQIEAIGSQLGWNFIGPGEKIADAEDQLLIITDARSLSSVSEETMAASQRILLFCEDGDDQNLPTDMRAKTTTAPSVEMARILPKWLAGEQDDRA